MSVYRILEKKSFPAEVALNWLREGQFQLGRGNISIGGNRKGEI